ncbi:MAG: sulfatase activating formylglycine-generating enzyme [Verrucomicrobiales bacterium]|jgi:formylglycine-generating enzyme required for sulfatase activity
MHGNVQEWCQDAISEGAVGVDEPDEVTDPPKHKRFIAGVSRRSACLLPENANSNIGFHPAVVPS